MELILRHGKNELCIYHESGVVGFTVLLSNSDQLNFSVDENQWEQLKTFINDGIYEYKHSLEKKPSDDSITLP